MLNRANTTQSIIGSIHALNPEPTCMVRKATTDLEVSVSPVQCVKVLRRLIEEAGWKIERHEGARLVDRFAIIVPMAQSTRTIGIRVLDGPLFGLELACWSETRGSHGAINIASFLLPGGTETPVTKALLDNWVANLPRCPWRWTFSERSQVGYLLPVWRKARKKFSALGFETGKRDWPYQAKTTWPVEENDQE